MKLNSPFWFQIGTIILIIVPILNGCTTERIIYQNQTIERMIEIPCPTCPVCINTTCPTCDHSDYIDQVRETSDDLKFCHIQQDLLDEMLTECRLQNTTEYVGDIGDNYTICKRELTECENKINNITEII